MNAALIGLIGVLAGAGIAGAVGFWSTRRSELAAAVITATIVVDELIAIRAALEEDASSPEALSRVSSLASFWKENRASLVLYLRAPQFVAMNGMVRLSAELVASGASVGSARADMVAESIDAVLGWLVQRTEELREAHQAFILTPLLKYLASRPWRRKRAEDGLRSARFPSRLPRA